MQFSDEFLQKWEHIIDEVVKTEIPLECIKKVVFRLHNKRQRTVNLGTLKRQGLDMDQIEVALTRVLTQYGEEIRDVEWVVDAALVAEIVQPETDRLLEKLK